MKLEYIAYGFSRVLICIIAGIILGVSLRLLNINDNISLDISIVFVNILLIYSGYSFCKYKIQDKYKKSLLLSLIISFSLSLAFFFLKNFDFIISLKSFFNLFLCMVLGVFINFLRFNFKNKS